MPSVLDATVVIQMVHFLCAYWILSRFFLKPAYDHVMSIDRARAALKHATAQQQEELALLREQKIVELTQLQQDLQNGSRADSICPSKHPSWPRLHADTCNELPALSQKSKNELVKELVAHLKNKATHE